MTSALAGLRAATRDIHERLHLHPAFAPLTGPPDLPGYVRLLARLYGFHAPVERWLFAGAEHLLPQLDDLPSRRKAGNLLADLKAIGVAMPVPAVELRVEAELTQPTVLGCLYVVEGATLGGRELGRRLVPTLAPIGLEAPAGRLFLLSYGDRQGEMFRRFCAVLENVACRFTAADQSAMEAAAITLFRRFEGWLSGDRAGLSSIIDIQSCESP